MTADARDTRSKYCPVKPYELIHWGRCREYFILENSPGCFIFKTIELQPGIQAVQYRRSCLSMQNPSSPAIIIIKHVSLQFRRIWFQVIIQGEIVVLTLFIYINQAGPIGRIIYGLEPNTGHCNILISQSMHLLQTLDVQLNIFTRKTVFIRLFQPVVSDFSYTI